MYPSLRSSFTLLLIITLALTFEGFVAASASAQVATGTPPFGSFGGGPEVINLANLNSHLTVPVLHKPGRGADFTYDLSYDTSVWYPVGSTGIQSWQPVNNFGWRGVTEVSTGYISYNAATFTCQNDNGTRRTYWDFSDFVYHDSFGSGHPFDTTALDDAVAFCNAFVGFVGTVTATDGSGYSLTVNGGITSNAHAYINSSNGTLINAPQNVSSGTANFIDRNGNQITADTSGHFYDTLSSTSPVLTVAGLGTPANPTTFTYTASSGASAPYTMKYTSYLVQTAFGCSGITEYGSNGTTSANLVGEIDLPDGSKYTFAYESTPGVSGHVTGRLASITLPTGGTITYGYSGGSSGHITCADGSTSTLTRTLSDGASWSATWAYARTLVSGTQWQTIVTDPTTAANQTSINFQGIYETQRKIYSGSTNGTLLQTINTCYNAALSPCTGTAITLPIAKRYTLATIPGAGNLIAQHVDLFDSYGNPTESDDYDFATASPFPLLRQTLFTYAILGNYLNAFKQTVIVKDGSGAIKSRQDTSYDQYSSFTGANCITGVPNHDDTGHGCSFTARGNVTSTTSYTNPVTPSGGITKNFTFDSLGNLRTAQLNCCQLETLAYSTATAYAYPDSITRGPSSPQLTTAITYDPHMGLILTLTDPNSIQTTLTYDNVGRPLTATTGSLPPTNYTYTDSGNWSVKVCSPVQGTQTACQNTILDGLGRTKTTQLLDGSPTLYSATDSQYDSLGRAYKTSNPYTTSASYWTQLGFDVLGRATSTTLPDNSVSSTSYADNSVTATDPAGKQRKAVLNGLGHLASVYEPDPSNGNALTLQTSYAYNVFDQLTQVTQGSQTRTFVYDALGRLNSSTTPEAGTVCFGTLSGNTCQSNGYDSWNNLLYRTDARGVVTNYLYDSLNRLVGITYPTVPGGVSAMPNVCAASGSTNNANACYTYGTSAASFNNGRLTAMTDTSGSESYSYDSYGNVSRLAKKIGSTTYTTNYQYNYSGQLSQITYPSGRAVVQNLDTLGRLSSIVGTLNSVQTTYASGFTYTAAQQTSALKYGNNLYASFGFSPDTLLPQCLDYSTTNRSSCAHDSSTKFGLNYSFPASPANNGQIVGITDAVDNGRSASYTYDSLYRLTAATTTGSTSYPKWGLSETYDRYGNRTLQAISSGCTGITCPTNSVSVNTTTNRVTGSPYTYDTSGNMTNDGVNTLVYDGENRATSATNGGNSGTYTYDGKGFRIKKVAGSTTTFYIFSGSKVVAEYDNGAAPTSPSREYIYSSGTLLAKIDSSGTKYYHQDHLSNRLVTDSSGNTSAQLGHFPFGESWYNASSDKLLFTTYERDSESGNDFAMARHGISRLGRFSSPDPFGGSLLDPQSMNRFSYALNDPCNFTDFLGLSPCKFNISIKGAGKIGADQLKALEDEMNRILGAGNSELSAQFNQGDADFTVTLANYGDFKTLFYPWKTGPQVHGNNDAIFSDTPVNSAHAYVDNTRSDFKTVDLGVALGRVSAHEFGHWALQIVHDFIADTNGHPGRKDEIGLMAQGDAPIQNGAVFDASQIPRLQKLCGQKHPGGGSGGGLGQGGGGQWVLIGPTYSGENGSGGYFWIWWPGGWLSRPRSTQ